MTFKLDFPGKLCRASFAILAMVFWWLPLASRWYPPNKFENWTLLFLLTYQCLSITDIYSVTLIFFSVKGVNPLCFGERGCKCCLKWIGHVRTAELGEQGAIWIKTLPKAQRTQGLSSAYQSNLMGHITSSNTNLDQISQYLNQSISISTKLKLQNIDQT